MWRITQDDENMLPKVRNALCLRQKQKGELYMAEYFVCKKSRLYRPGREKSAVTG